ncbi:hypothetical protein [Nostoc sp. NMS8]|uniref:hypothetical protein n=1 Tax=Nostoc sp. NMS8 TaxID=2815392 RepID=UPI0025F8D1EB|nr:hypothetical protein [Nostoc sp. NMS8]MBN3961253.1 hypothetical protein [Nostoc sp. NMS8]
MDRAEDSSTSLRDAVAWFYEVVQHSKKVSNRRSGTGYWVLGIGKDYFSQFGWGLNPHQNRPSP